jgi:hypothetical protein
MFPTRSSTFLAKQRREATIIEAGLTREGVSRSEAHRRAWAILRHAYAGFSLPAGRRARS